MFLLYVFRDYHSQPCCNSQGYHSCSWYLWFQDMPTSEDKIEFSQFNSQYLEEIVISYDLESMLVPVKGEKMFCNECLGICKCYDESKKSFSVTKQLHSPNVCSYCVVDKNGKVLEQESKVCFKTSCQNVYLLFKKSM